MLNQNDILHLQQLIKVEGNKSPTILGARIGDIVKIKFPDVKIKREYGSISKLIENHLSQFLTFSAKHGKDNEYAFKEAMQAAINEPPPPPLSHEPLSRDIDHTLAHQPLLVLEPHLHDEILRRAIKASLDTMTSEQLRQLALPAGILFDAICKTNRL